MLIQELSLISRMWNHLCPTGFDLVVLANRMQSALGHDGVDTAPEEFLNAFSAIDGTDWNEVGWASREILGGLDVAERLSPEDYVMTIAFACILAESIRRGCYEWSGSVDDIVQVVYHNLDKGHNSFRAALFTLLFRQA